MGSIDFHTHAFPDDLAARAIAKLQGDHDWKAVAVGTVRELLASMDKADVDVSLLCTVATKPEQVEGILKWCGEVRGDRIEPLPSVHPDDDRPDKWVHRFADEGFAGIKLHPMYQDFVADERRMDGIYAAAAERGLLVVMHCGRDIAYPAEDDRAMPQRMRAVSERFGGLRLVCTHMGGWRAWDEVEKHLIGSGVLIETSFSLADLDPQRAADMILRHGVDKVMLGSDWPWNAQADEIARVHALPLSESQKQKILWSNAGRLLY